MRLDPFPRTTTSKAITRPPAFDEYRADVIHHLSTAERAAKRCRSRVEDCQFLIQGEKVTLLYFYVAGLAEAGDTAIRAAVSAAELGLQMTNFLLCLGIKKHRVDWASVQKEVERQGAVGASLVSALKSLSGSIGWEKLIAYRNWVTHRGAPVVLAPTALTPVEISAAPVLADAPTIEERRRSAIIESANQYVLERSEVLCWPFVPPVHGILDDHDGTPVAPGLGISLPAGAGIKLKQNRVQVGSLLEEAASYHAKNAVSLGREVITRAGEVLERYRAWDYIHAVDQVVHLADDALCGSWDAELHALLIARAQAPGSRLGGAPEQGVK